METASRVEEIFAGVFRWEIFSAEHRVELTSHAVLEDGRLFCFDPVALEEEAFDQLSRLGRPEAIVVTNENHLREALLFRERWRVPVWTSAWAKLSLPDLFRIGADEREWRGWQLHPLPGGAGGELAFRIQDRSLVLVGDAVVNLPGRGLEILPEKYCEDPVLLRRGLRELASAPFERLCMAHGKPLMERASERVIRAGAG
jgi:glyoxylase-like metal-dependent hydrolase (beta-lactamase superfamily II)